MARLLFIEGSPRKHRSVSTFAADAFLKAYAAANPSDTIDVFDIWNEELPQLDLDCDSSIAITHVKPGEMAAVTGQLAELDIRMPVFALTRGERYRF